MIDKRDKIKQIMKEYVTAMWYTDYSITQFEKICTHICGMSTNPPVTAQEDLDYLNEKLQDVVCFDIDTMLEILTERYFAKGKNKN